MERHCKNCSKLLYEGQNFCSKCGAKWIDKRITMRKVGSDFADMYIGFDTKFMRTFLDLFTKPDQVINGYIYGRRMNYMDATRYLLLAVFITGISVFIMNNSDGYQQVLDAQLSAATVEAKSEVDQQKMLVVIKEFINTINNYQGFILILSLPILALAARITFWGKRFFNYTEQVVFYMYTYGHSTIILALITIILMLANPQLFMEFSFISAPLLFLYNAFCYKKVFNLSIGQTILRSLIGLVVIIIVFTILTLIIAGVGMVVASFYEDELKELFI